MTTLPSTEVDFLRVKGHDSFGPWTMVVTEDEAPEGCGNCSCCGRPVKALLSYYQIKLPADIPVSGTILKQTRNPIGVSCGCWSKFQRQVVHITESAYRKGIPV